MQSLKGLEYRGQVVFKVADLQYNKASDSTQHILKPFSPSLLTANPESFIFWLHLFNSIDLGIYVLSVFILQKMAVLICAQVPVN